MRQTLRAGTLPGTVYGRLCDCVAPVSADLAEPLTTALSGATNLGSTIVVSSRAAAVAALDYLERSKAGCLKCLIVEETETPETPALPAAFCRHRAVSLADCIQAKPGCEAALPVVQKLLSRWVLVPAWADAEACAASQKHAAVRFGLVTKCAPFCHVLLPFCPVSPLLCLLPCTNRTPGLLSSPLGRLLAQIEGSTILSYLFFHKGRTAGCLPPVRMLHQNNSACSKSNTKLSR